MVRFIPFFILSEHRIQDGQQFAHTCNQRHLFGFSCCNQPRVKRFYHWIKAGCDECAHVKCGSYSRSTTKDGSSASHGARIPVYRSNSHERADFSPRKPTQFRNLSQQCGHGHGAYPLNIAQPLGKLFKVISDMGLHILIDPRKFIFQRFDDDINTLSALRMSRMQPVTLCDEHRDQLPSANDHSIENLTFGIR